VTKNERATERERERKRKRKREREREKEKKREREKEKEKEREKEKEKEREREKEKKRKRKRKREREKERERETHPYETCPQEHESRHTIHLLSGSNHTYNPDQNSLLYMCTRYGPYMCDWAHARVHMSHGCVTHNVCDVVCL